MKKEIKKYKILVNDTEINDRYLSKKEVEKIAKIYADEGYDIEIIEIITNR